MNYSFLLCKQVFVPFSHIFNSAGKILTPATSRCLSVINNVIHATVWPAQILEVTYQYVHANTTQSAQR